MYDMTDGRGIEAREEILYSRLSEISSFNRDSAWGFRAFYATKYGEMYSMTLCRLRTQNEILSKPSRAIQCFGSNAIQKATPSINETPRICRVVTVSP